MKLNIQQQNLLDFIIKTAQTHKNSSTNWTCKCSACDYVKKVIQIQFK